MPTPQTSPPQAIDADDPPSKDRLYVTALARGLRILRCFTHDTPELSTAEVVRMTGLPQPTVWRLCHTLEREGFISCSGASGKMTLGLPALAMAHLAVARQELPQLSLPYLQGITRRHRMGTSLSVRDGLDMLYLQRTHGDITFMNDPVGARRPLATAPTGWACLAAYDEAERAQVMAALGEQQGAAWPVLAARLEAARHEYLECGFITSLGVMHELLHAVAVPIRIRNSRQVWGLSASGLASDWPRDRLAAVGQELSELAGQLANALG